MLTYLYAQLVFSTVCICLLFTDEGPIKDMPIKKFFGLIYYGLLETNPIYYLIKFIYKSYKK